MDKFKLSGKVVVITGSTGGLGTAMAEALVQKGAKLALMDLDLVATQAQSKKLGDIAMVRGWQVDVRRMDSITKAMDEAALHFGGLDIVLASAGIATMAPISKLEVEAFERVIDINLNGVWRTFKAALPHVRKQHGYLAAVSSMAAFVHSPLQSPYTASKAGVWALCDSIRLELRHLNVAVGSYHPTFFPTPMMDDVVSDPAGNKLWGGNAKGIWKMITTEEVVRQIILGIERRASMVVIPRSNTLVAKSAGLFRPLIEWLGFKDYHIQEAISLSDKSGWHQKR
ncbi:SDR family NAD(P)-dependent oxidoreductase [Pseudomonas sp. BGM005]|nr:SDR family NAD(P)-dependent oxidoreductase [Pseudomonas sp. BG5]